MNLFEMIPWSQLANHLQTKARDSSGIEGAIIGTFYGAAHAMSRIEEPITERHIQNIAAGAALGTVFGFVEHDPRA